MTLEFALFDLDDTLYPRTSPVMPAIGERIKTFMIDSMGLNYEEASQRRNYFNQRYGSVLRGLLQEDTVDIDAYLDFIHDIPITNFLQPNPALSRMLAAIPLRKFIFTNSYYKHAENVMAALGVSQHFEDIFDIRTVNFVSKPARHSYTVVINHLETTAEACIYIDDKAVNLEEPKKMGMRTILIDDEPNEWVDALVGDILDVGTAIQEFISENEATA